MTKAIIGVDGGVSGAIASITEDGTAFVMDIPTREVKVGDKTRRVFDPDPYLNFLRGLGVMGLDIERALFEAGREIPYVGNDGRRRKQSGMYAYGFTNGQTYMGAFALDIACQIVEPQTWKRALHLLGKDKAQSRERASALYPKAAHLWPNVGHHNRAEAVLIAHYGWSLM